MLDEVGVVKIRTFLKTGMDLGVGKDDGSYYVYDRSFGESSFAWHMHVGPYSTFDDAVQWIRDIREDE